MPDVDVKAQILQVIQGGAALPALPDPPVSSVLSSFCPFAALAGNRWLQGVYGTVYKEWDFEVTKDTEKLQNLSFSCLMPNPAVHYPSRLLPAFAYPRCHGLL